MTAGSTDVPAEWHLTVGEALSELMRWTHSAQIMAIRTLDPDAGDYTREGDVRLFAMAVRQVLRFAELTYDKAREDQAPEIREAINAFDAVIPAAKVIRDLVDHWDDYMKGTGRAYPAGDPRHAAGSPWVAVVRPFGSWAQWIDGEYVLYLAPRPGTVLQLDVRPTAAAASELSHAIQNALDTEQRGIPAVLRPTFAPLNDDNLWYLIGPSGTGKTAALPHLQSLGLNTIDLDQHFAAGTHGDMPTLLKLIDDIDKTAPTVIALGAGTQDIDRVRATSDRPLPATLAPWLRRRPDRVIYLDTPADLLWERLRNDGTRTHVHDNLEHYIEVELHDARRDVYAAAKHTIDTINVDPSDVAVRIAAIINRAQ